MPVSKAFEVVGADVPLSAETIRHYHRFLSSVLGVAVKWQIIPSNPCTRATLMINSGVPLPTISARLGHANPTTTAKIYTHTIKTADAAAAEQLNNILSAGTNRKRRTESA